MSAIQQLIASYGSSGGGGGGSSGTGWNPSDSSPNTAANMTFSDSNRVVVKNTSSVACMTRGALLRAAGKWYAEIQCTNVSSSAGTFVVGIIQGNESLSNSGWTFSGNAVYYRASGEICIPPSAGTNIGAYTTGDVIGMAIDFSTRRVWFSKNGTFSGDPVAGTGQARTLSAATNFGIVFAPTAGGGAGQIATINNASGSQTYSPPSGYTAWG